MKFKVEGTQNAMKNPRQGAIIIFGGLVFFLCSSWHSAIAQDRKNDCKHLPKILSQPSFSEEDRNKWKGKAVSGKVAIVVSEEGDVTQARVVSASPKEAAESLLNAAKKAKFGPRPGCSELKTEVVFSMNQ